MLKRAKEILLASDLALAGLILTACVVTYLFWIGPNLDRAGGKASATALHDQRQQTHKSARMKCMGIRRSLHDIREEVEAQGGGMPSASAINQRIAALTAAAQRNGVTIEEVQPGPTVPIGGHLETQISLRAKTTYSAFRRFLSGLEHDMPFVDVTHFSISATGGSSTPDCRVAWVVRLYSQASGTNRKVAQATARSRGSSGGETS